MLPFICVQKDDGGVHAQGSLSPAHHPLAQPPQQYSPQRPDLRSIHRLRDLQEKEDLHRRDVEYTQALAWQTAAAYLGTGRNSAMTPPVSASPNRVGAQVSLALPLPIPLPLRLIVLSLPLPRACAPCPAPYAHASRNSLTGAFFWWSGDIVRCPLCYARAGTEQCNTTHKMQTHMLRKRPNTAQTLLGAGLVCAPVSAMIHESLRLSHYRVIIAQLHINILANLTTIFFSSRVAGFCSCNAVSCCHSAAVVRQRLLSPTMQRPIVADV